MDRLAKEITVKKRVRTKVCDYCGHEKVKPDQRERQLVAWVRVVYKHDVDVYYHMDMCPDCVAHRGLIKDAKQWQKKNTIGSVT